MNGTIMRDTYTPSVRRKENYEHHSGHPNPAIDPGYRSSQSRLLAEIGDERTEAFELYEALRRLQRQGAAGEILSATNPLLASPYYDEGWDEDEDE